jgi:hypothetical protein
MAWSKDADWLPLTNALELVEFWKVDLRQAQELLHKFNNPAYDKLPNVARMRQLAEKSVMESQEGLNEAEEKLEETMERLGLED